MCLLRQRASGDSECTSTHQICVSLSELSSFRMHTQLLQSCPILCDPWTVAHRLLCPWDSPCKNTGVGCHALLQQVLLTQGSNPCLLCLLQCRRLVFHPWIGKTPWRRTCYSSILAWRIPWTEKPGRLQSMGSQRVGHD